MGGPPVAATVIAALFYVAWDQANYNFGMVQQYRLYRSGQMPATALARTIRDHRIKTVLNLRGANKDSWYAAERATTLEAGATQVDIPMSSCVWMSRAQLATLIATLDTAEYPILIHCQWGAERTGLASAFAELLRPDSTLEDARRQFSIRYLVRAGQRWQDHGRAPGSVRAMAAAPMAWRIRPPPSGAGCRTDSSPGAQPRAVAL